MLPYLQGFNFINEADLFTNSFKESFSAINSYHHSDLSYTKLASELNKTDSIV
jgi:hypothetical protein